MPNDDIKSALRKHTQEGAEEHTLFPRVMLSLLESTETAEKRLSELAQNADRAERAMEKRVAEVQTAIKETDTAASERYAKSAKSAEVLLSDIKQTAATAETHCAEITAKIAVSAENAENRLSELAQKAAAAEARHAEQMESIAASLLAAIKQAEAAVEKCAKLADNRHANLETQVAAILAAIEELKLAAGRQRTMQNVAMFVGVLTLAGIVAALAAVFWDII